MEKFFNFLKYAYTKFFVPGGPQNEPKSDTKKFFGSGIGDVGKISSFKKAGGEQGGGLSRGGGGEKGGVSLRAFRGVF